MNGLATAGVYWNRGASRAVLPPRALVTGFSKGMALGEPNDEETHRAVLRQAVAMLRKDATVEEVR